MRGEDQHRLLVAGDGLAELAEFVQALSEQRRRRDRVDPPLRAEPDAPLVVVAGDVGGRGIVASGERLQGERVVGRGHRLHPTRHAHGGRQHDLPRRRADGDAGDQTGQRSATHASVVQEPPRLVIAPLIRWQSGKPG